jgi:serine/threonine-protein kinase
VEISSEFDPLVVGRYLLHRQIARGGMATIHLAHLVGDVGFSRIVAAKRLHTELAENAEFVTMFLDEARVASKVHHRNIVPVLDLVTAAREVVLVQEYVRGAPLSRLLQTAADASTYVPLPIAASIATQTLAALHAAHETTDEMGTPLRVVHRDVSPQNIMVATDGTARLLDFGVAKAAMAAHVTQKGTFKGKLSYSAPEHIRGSATHQSDIFSLSIVLWELVTGRRLHRANLGMTKLIERIMAGQIPLVTEELAEQRALTSGYRWQQIEALAPIIARGLAPEPRERWKTASEMEEVITNAVPIASGTDTAEWLSTAAREFLEERERMVAEEEARWRSRGRAISAGLPVDLAIPVAREASGPAHAIDFAPAQRFISWVTRRLPRQIAIGFGALLVLLLAMVIAWPHGQPAVPQPEAVPDDVAPPSAAIPPMPRLETPEERCAPPAVTHTVAPPRPIAATKRIVHVAKSAAPPRPPAPRPPPPPPVVKAAPKPPAVNCNPPYYFDGTKKVFKPACV